MTDEELNKMIGEFLPYPAEGQHYALKQFAKLVAAAEREEIAKFMLLTDLSGLRDELQLANYTATLLAKYAEAIRARGQE